MYFLCLTILTIPYTTGFLYQFYIVFIKGESMSYLNNHSTDFDQYQTVALYMFLLRGVVIPLIRFTEPQFFQPIVNCLRRLVLRTRKLTPEQQRDLDNNADSQENSLKNYLKHFVQDDPDIAFLSSSLNNLLVCGILKGINFSLTEEGSYNSGK